MASYDYDLFTIGAGSGGVRASRMSASYGARVAVAEERFLGGTCVNVGCIPKKLLSYAAHFHADFEDAAGFGWSVGATGFDWARLIANKDKEIARLNGIYRKLLEGAGVTLYEGRARIVDAHTVEVLGKRYAAANILVATGGRPVVPDIPGRELAITSNEAFFLPRRPDHAIVVGGGYIAVEFASIFNGLGCRTTQLYRGPLFLRGFDHDVRTTLAEEMRKKGVDLRFDADIARLDAAGGRIRATLRDGSTIETDLVMFATGRKPNTAGLGLEAAGVALDAEGAVVVDDHFATNVPSIRALGDVIDRVQLTPVAIAEAMALSRTLFRGEPTTMNYANIPTAVFSHPNIGTVGLTEEAARKRFPAVEIFRATFRGLKHTLSGRDEKTMMKLVVDKATDRVLGCHMVGPEAGEIVQGLGIALKCGATKAQFDATVGIHPTAAEEFVTMRTPVPQPAAQAAE
ncbi:MAG: glutathione-disulfide reductase [Alphaproteobacteria bacterium]|nr:glutathione-disulfide reductase [Alphaproteobacteria bacterium]